MYVIVVYDVDAERTHIPRKFLRKYLTHVQNSVFEGEITEGQAEEIKQHLSTRIRDDESVYIYTLWSEKYVERTIIGEDPMDDNQII